MLPNTHLAHEWGRIARTERRSVVQSGADSARKYSASVAALQRSLAQDVLSALPAVTIAQRYAGPAKCSTDRPWINVHPLADCCERFAGSVEPDGLADTSRVEPRVAAWQALTTHLLDHGVPIDVVTGGEVIDCCAPSGNRPSAVPAHAHADGADAAWVPPLWPR